MGSDTMLVDVAVCSCGLMLGAGAFTTGFVLLGRKVLTRAELTPNDSCDPRSVSDSSGLLAPLHELRRRLGPRGGSRI